MVLRLAISFFLSGVFHHKPNIPLDYVNLRIVLNPLYRYSRTCSFDEIQLLLFTEHFLEAYLNLDKQSFVARLLQIPTNTPRKASRFLLSGKG